MVYFSNILQSESETFVCFFPPGSPFCRSCSFSVAWPSWRCSLPLWTEHGGNPPLALSNTKTSSTLHIWYLSFLETFYHITLKLISDKGTALYGWMTERTTFLICWQDICADTLKMCQWLKHQGNSEVLYGLIPNCLILLIRQSCCFAHTFTQVPPDEPAQQNRYYWTSFFKMHSTLNCLNMVCIVTVSDVAAAYLLKIRQATYSFFRRAPPTLHHFVLISAKKVSGRSVTLESSLHQSTAFFSVLYLPHTVQSASFDLCLNK